MSDDGELIRGSGNAFRDFGHVNADAEQLKALLAAQIVGLLDTRRLTVRVAEAASGYAAADFSRIRRANLDRFTLGRLTGILDRFDQRVDVAVAVRPRPGTAA